MKTLHLTNAWHPASGGVATFYRALLKEANAQRREVRLLVPGQESREEDVGRYGRIYYVRSPRAPSGSGYRMILPSTFLRPGGPVVEILRRERPDLVEINDKYTLPYLAGLLRLEALWGVSFRPVVVGLSCERFDETVAAYLTHGRFLRRLSRHYMKWLYFPMCDHHIAVSWHTAAELRTAARGHRVERAVWVRPMGVDAALMSPTRRSGCVRRKLLGLAGGGPDTCLILYAGRLAPEKNLDLLLKTVALLPPRFRLLVAGDGPLLGLLRRRAVALGGRAVFLGHIGSREELADLYANCDAFVHPNPREPFGIAPLEAMASGLPLIAPETGGVRTYAHPSNAWLARPEPQDYAVKVLEACTCSAERDAKTAAARATAEEYDWPRICSGYLDLYAQIYAMFAQGAAPVRHRPDFVSTPGDRFGRERVRAREAT